MPYPNEHAARIKEPEAFQPDSFRRKEVAPGVEMIMGKLKGEETMTAQACRFDKEKFTPEEAKAWLKEHDIAYTDFEPAAEQKNNAHMQTFNIEGVEIFSVGKWNGDKYTSADLDEMVKAFDAVGFQPPLKLGHNTEQEKDGGPAFGWVGKLYRKGEKLLADFKELPQKLYEAMKRGNYKRVSSEIYWNYEANDKAFPFVLKAVSILGADIPAVTNLEAIQGLYAHERNEYHVYTELDKEESMDKEKEIAELKEQIKNLTANSATEKEALEAKIKAIESEKEAVITELSERNAEVKAAEIKAFVDAEKKAGRVLPAFEKELVALLSSANETKTYSYAHDGKTVELSQRETIERLVKSLPKLIHFGEVGEVDADEAEKQGHYDNAGTEVDRRAKAYMKKNKTTDYTAAVKQVLADDAELKKDYIGG